MASRVFQDSAGTTWTVWETYPTRPTTVPAAWRGGWLTFQSGTDRRRLAPIPKGWNESADPRLELMCKAAEAFSRATPIKGIESFPGE
ncbi:MAG TPA: hypothetical protein VH277_20245 [Gemmatimonadaceae bacterium]|nr:hypothetical protein [Gemmatimonadaceae bacterium]